MHVQPLSRPVLVPSNSSRFFRVREQALNQSIGSIELAWRASDPYVFNLRFDASKISHDDFYCTSVVNLDEVAQIPTASYFSERVLPRLSRTARVTDIGCGQGEFVRALRSQGVDAVGFDPVLRSPTTYLHKRYWSPDDPIDDAGSDIFVMRCVLPHIAYPWEFIGRMAESNPRALILIEFQRLEWILQEAIWYQISHDHVNLFSADDFDSRFSIIDQGTFSNGEWAWVLIDAGSFRTASEQACDKALAIRDLFEIRARTLKAASGLGRPVALWGAAGKGIVLSYALASSGAEVLGAIDADQNRHGRYMEASGIQVLSPTDAQQRVPPETLVLVCNPNHLPEVRDWVGNRWDICLPSDLS